MKDFGLYWTENRFRDSFISDAHTGHGGDLKNGQVISLTHWSDTFSRNRGDEEWKQYFYQYFIGI